MVATPWGDSDSLRERRLKPGPGASADEVKRNQRERLYGATVAAVCSLGYEATRVADICEVSGVSSRSFYDLFENKEACFVATLKAIVEPLTAVLAAAGDGEGEREERIRRIFDTFGQLVLAQPVTARFVVTEAYAAGPVAWDTLDRLMAALEEMARSDYARTKEHPEMPRELIGAQIGAIQEITRAKLRDGSPEDLVSVLPKLGDLLGIYEPPSEPLRLGSRVPPSRPESVEGHDDAERALRAFAIVVAERGIGGATIHEIARRGAMSPTTFYANFRDKEDALLAAIDSVMAQVMTAANAAFGRGPDWPTAVRAAIGAMLNLLASRPAMAHLLTVDIFAGGAEAMRRRQTAARPLRALFAQGQHLAPAVPAVAIEAIAGGITALVRRRIIEDGAGALPSLAPVCTYFALAPFIGTVEATTAANGDGRARARASTPLPDMLVRVAPTKWTILSLVARWPVTAEVVATELEAPLPMILESLEELVSDRLVERVPPESTGDSAKWTMQRDFHFFDGPDWEELSLEEREEISRKLHREMAAEVEVAFETGTMNRRFDNHTSRIRVSVDEQGWKEMGEIHRAAVAASQLAHTAAARRLRESGETPIEGVSHQGFFEVPPDFWPGDATRKNGKDPEPKQAADRTDGDDVADD